MTVEAKLKAQGLIRGGPEFFRGATVLKKEKTLSGKPRAFFFQILGHVFFASASFTFLTPHPDLFCFVAAHVFLHRGGGLLSITVFPPPLGIRATHQVGFEWSDDDVFPPKMFKCWVTSVPVGFLEGFSWCGGRFQLVRGRW